MAEVVSWPPSQTCPRCHWKRLNTRLQENGAGETSFQHSSAPGARQEPAALSMRIQPAPGKGLVTYGLYANFIAHQREEYALQWAFPTISHTSLISYHTICPYETSQTDKFFMCRFLFGFFYGGLIFTLSAEFLSFFPQFHCELPGRI